MSSQKHYAAIDVGSNTVRLLVGHVEKGKVEQLYDDSRFVRLGLGVDRARRLQPEREEAALRAIEELASYARSMKADPVLIFATSAVRDAENGPEFAGRVREATGLELDIISGEQEAELTYLGATMGVDSAGDMIVCDLGGGSAELIYASGGDIVWATSKPLGSGRLTERFVHHDPPTQEEEGQVQTYVREVLESLRSGGGRVDAAVFTGGTATHLGVIATGTRSSVDITFEDLKRAVDKLNSEPSTAIVARFNFDPERARVLPAGGRALQTVAEFYGVQRIRISRSGIREGAILRAAGTR